MTLGSWFRDYVYIPLGETGDLRRESVFQPPGSMASDGFWHGAGWNFIIWGLFLFVVIAIEKSGLKRSWTRYAPLGHLYMLLLIPLSWMIFAITDKGQLWIVLRETV